MLVWWPYKRGSACIVRQFFRTVSGHLWQQRLIKHFITGEGSNLNGNSEPFQYLTGSYFSSLKFYLKKTSKSKYFHKVMRYIWISNDKYLRLFNNDETWGWKKEQFKSDLIILKLEKKWFFLEFSTEERGVVRKKYG